MTQRTIFLVGIFFIFFNISNFASETIQQNEKSTVTVQSLFPLTTDLSWRYERMSREGVSHYTTRYIGTLRKDNEILHILSNPFGASYYTSDQKTLKIRGIANAEDIKNVNFYQQGDITRIQIPIRKGKRWHGRALIEKEEDIIVTGYETEILGWDKVEVPAGKFDSIVTSSTQNTIFIKRETGEGKGMFTYEKVWYAPGIGMVRRDMYLIYPGNPPIPFRDDKLEEFISEKKRKD